MLFILLKFLITALAIVTVLYLLVIMPKLRRNPYAGKLDGWLYAHRGLHNNKSEAPENSLRAFALAVEHGFGIELDVQLTKDLVPVILHDYNLKRACEIDLKVSEHDYKELKDFKLFKSQERIPTFREVLKLVDGRVPLIVELKIPWKAARLCKTVSEILKDYKGVYCIESFNPFGLIWYKKHLPEVVRGQLATDFGREKIEGNKLQYFILKHLLMNFLSKPDFIAYHHIYKKGLSFTICRKLYRVKTIAWTIQTQEEYNKSRKYYELFIFDSFIPEKES
jgi:glycerophosphoryl diester phosphodiesterase